jgi:hypothetical protein
MFKHLTAVYISILHVIAVHRVEKMNGNNIKKTQQDANVPSVIVYTCKTIRQELKTGMYTQRENFGALPECDVSHRSPWLCVHMSGSGLPNKELLCSETRPGVHVPRPLLCTNTCVRCSWCYRLLLSLCLRQVPSGTLQACQPSLT